MADTADDASTVVFSSINFNYPTSNNYNIVIPLPVTIEDVERLAFSQVTS